MKALLDYIRNANLVLPMPLVWAALAGHYGVHCLIVIVYITDWIISGGQRSELLELLRVLN